MTDKLSQQAAKNMKDLRQGLKLTQKQLADKAGLHPNYYARIERGDIKKPAVDVYGKIAKALDVELSYIFKN